MRKLLLLPSDPDATAWANSVRSAGGTLSGGRLQLVTKLIRSLKASNVWYSLDRLWIYASENAIQARRDLVARAVCTPVNTPTMTANRGYTSDGSTSYINLGFIPSTDGVKFTQNSASLFSYTNTTRAAADMQTIGLRSAADGTGSLVTPFFSSSLLAGAANCAIDAGFVSGSVPDALGLSVVSRTGASAQAVYRRAGLIASNTTASTALATATLFALARNNAVGTPERFDTARNALVGIGGGLDAGKVAALNAAVEAYLSSIGANA